MIEYSNTLIDFIIGNHENSKLFGPDLLRMKGIGPFSDFLFVFVLIFFELGL